MEKIFVPYKTAVLLKEKGYNEKCIAFYYLGQLRLTDTDSTFINGDKSDVGFASTPLYCEAIDWLLEKHGIFVSPIYNRASNQFDCIVDAKDKVHQTGFYKSKQEALNLGIKMALSLI